jgi:UDP-N-acetyl-D-mannosaminuronic acid dehydrogenase
MTDRKSDICIIGGCGHIGVPLGLAFADHGQRVVLYDINKGAVESVNRKEMPFREEGAPELLAKMVESGMLAATSDAAVISRAPILIMVIGTPVDEYLNPRLQDIMRATKEIFEYLNDDQLLVLRSTVFPGVSEKVRNFLRAAGKRTEVSFCPERIAEGYALTELESLPQIVSAFTPEALARARKLFSILTREIVELSPLEAELAKLFTNAWRYLNFAISNQFYMIAGANGLDFYRIYDAMVKNYPRLKGFPKPGFTAGPCLFKDTMQLLSFSNNSFFMGHAAMLVNEGLPDFIVGRLKLGGSLNEKTVGILGMAFKAESDDPRDSLSFKLKKILELEARKVLCSDVFVRRPGFVSAEELVDRSDVIIVGTPHSAYRRLDLKGKEVIDVWDYLRTESRRP